MIFLLYPKDKFQVSYKTFKISYSLSFFIWTRFLCLLRIII